jgi:peptide deformylase
MTTPFLDAKQLRQEISDNIQQSELKIVDYPSKSLFATADFCDYSEQHYHDALEMFALHYNTDNCAALAATQLSFKKPLAITVIDFSSDKNQPLCLINPVLSEHSGQTKTEEGCMSVFPSDLHAKVSRAEKIRVQALDLYGNAIDFYADDFMAKCIQHETDHLHGTLYISRLGGVAKKILTGKLTKIVKTKDKK